MLVTITAYIYVHTLGTWKLQKFQIFCLYSFVCLQPPLSILYTWSVAMWPPPRSTCWKAAGSFYVEGCQCGSRKCCSLSLLVRGKGLIRCLLQFAQLALTTCTTSHLPFAECRVRALSQSVAQTVTQIAVVWASSSFAQFKVPCSVWCTFWLPCRACL